MNIRSLLIFFIIFISCAKGKKQVLFPVVKAPIILATKIYILPLGDIPKATIFEIQNKLRAVAPNVVLLPSEKMPAEAFYKPRNRYRADKIIFLLSKRAKTAEVYIGITNSDISATIIKKKVKFYDYGIMGLSYRPGKGSVVSSFRLKDKAMFYKVVYHELGHSQGLEHCPDTKCFMQDADSQDKTRLELGFCISCKKHLIARGFFKI